MLHGLLMAAFAAWTGVPGAGPNALAPGPRELASSTAELRRRLEAVEAGEVAAVRVHNAIAKHLSGPFAIGLACENAELVSLVARAKVFLEFHRDAAQSARASRNRLDRVVQAATVAPLLDATSLRRLDDLRTRTSQQIKRHLELRSWHGRWIEPIASRCRPTVFASPGLDGVDADPIDRGPRRVAVIGVGGGFICPEGQRADGRVVVLSKALACYGDAACTCAPESVLPGAVLSSP